MVASSATTVATRVLVVQLFFPVLLFFLTHPLWLDFVVRYLLDDGLELLLALDLDVGQVQDLWGSLLLVQDVLELELGIGHPVVLQRLGSKWGLIARVKA